MKIPTLEQAAAAIDAVAELGEQASAAGSLVAIVVDLFDKPHDRDTLKGAYAAAKARTDASLDRLDAALADAKKLG